MTTLRPMNLVEISESPVLKLSPPPSMYILDVEIICSLQEIMRANILCSLWFLLL